MDRSERIALAIKRSGLKNSEIASICGVTSSAVSQWISGLTKNIRPEYLANLAGATKTRMEWLATGEGSMSPSDYERSGTPHLQISEKDGQYLNVSEISQIRRSLPLISEVQAGNFCEATDSFHPGDAEEWIPCPVAHGPHAYALRVQGDSMTSPYAGQRSYPAGTIIFVDPDKSVINGSRVIAKDPETGNVTFKVYSEDGGRRFLKPINPTFPSIPITGNLHICGVVIGSFIPE